MYCLFQVLYRPVREFTDACTGVKCGLWLVWLCEWVSLWPCGHAVRILKNFIGMMLVWNLIRSRSVEAWFVIHMFPWLMSQAESVLFLRQERFVFDLRKPGTTLQRLWKQQKMPTAVLFIWILAGGNRCWQCSVERFLELGHTCCVLQ